MAAPPRSQPIARPRAVSYDSTCARGCIASGRTTGRARRLGASLCNASVRGSGFAIGRGITIASTQSQYLEISGQRAAQGANAAAEAGADDGDVAVHAGRIVARYNRVPW